MSSSGGSDESKQYLESTILECVAPEYKLREIVNLPDGVDYNEWVASHSKFHSVIDQNSKAPFSLQLYLSSITSTWSMEPYLSFVPCLVAPTWQALQTGMSSYQFEIVLI